MSRTNERPINLKGWEVRAFLEGRKTQIRRPAGWQTGVGHVWPKSDGSVKIERVAGGCGAGFATVTCPLGVAGDRLWVREAFWERAGDIYRRASSESAPWDLIEHRQQTRRTAWRPPMHMPRWASRLTLEIVSARVERLQDISVDDAMAEGIPQTGGEAHLLGLIDLAKVPGHEWDNRTSPENFAVQWDKDHGEKSPWKRNDWVWVPTVRVVQCHD